MFHRCFTIARPSTGNLLRSGGCVAQQTARSGHTVPEGLVMPSMPWIFDEKLDQQTSKVTEKKEVFDWDFWGASRDFSVPIFVLMFFHINLLHRSGHIGQEKQKHCNR